jgi:hypothetical protein
VRLGSIFVPKRFAVLRPRLVSCVLNGKSLILTIMEAITANMTVTVRLIPGGTEKKIEILVNKNPYFTGDLEPVVRQLEEGLALLPEEINELIEGLQENGRAEKTVPRGKFSAGPAASPGDRDPGDRDRSF